MNLPIKVGDYVQTAPGMRFFKLREDKPYLVAEVELGCGDDGEFNCKAHFRTEPCEECRMKAVGNVCECVAWHFNGDFVKVEPPVTQAEAALAKDLPSIDEVVEFMRRKP